MTGRRNRVLRHVRFWMLVFAVARVAAGAAQEPPVERPRGDPAARLLSASAATEYWDLTARFESGHSLLARFLITNEGPSPHYGVGMGHLLLPDGRAVPFRYGRQRPKWTLSSDGLSMKVASSALDLHAPVRQFALDSDKSGVKVLLQFPVSGAAVWPDGASNGEPFFDVVQMPAPVEGTIWLQGMAAPLPVRGTIALTHTWMNGSEPGLTQRRIEVFCRDGDVALYATELVTPAGARRRWAAVTRAGALVRQSQAIDLALGAARAAGDDAYPLPDRLQWRDAALSADIRPAQLLLQANPLDIVPQPFRLLLSFKSKPQRLWADAACDLTLAAAGGAALAQRGRGTVAATYLNPLPLPPPDRAAPPR